ncbi:MAG: S9 family peptidase [Acidobacteriota bacterium]
MKNLWIAPVDEPGAAVPLTEDRGRGIHAYQWAFDGRHVLFLQDRDGDETWRVLGVDVLSRAVRPLTPEGVRARMLHASPHRPGQVVVGLHQRDPRFADPHVLDLATGKLELLMENPGFPDLLLDDDYRVRFAGRADPDGGSTLMRLDDDGTWREWQKVPMEDDLTTAMEGLDHEGGTLYLVDSRGRDTSGLFTVDLATGERTLLHGDPRADVADVWFDPLSGRPVAVAVDALRKEWVALDPELAGVFEQLRAGTEGDPELVVSTTDGQLWLVGDVPSHRPFSYVLFDRRRGETRRLFGSRDALEGVAMAPMRPVTLEARDGLELPSYLTLPPDSDPDGDGRPEEPLPMVLEVHGGPWARDRYGHDPEHQLWANRGYAVLSINFRGSTGFGKRFVNAGNREWAGKMQEDLIDGVRWAVEEGIAREDRVAIQGTSYGGFAALVGMTQTPELFACGVDIVGPSSLLTVVESVPPHWLPLLDMWATRVGDFRSEEGRARLEQISPLAHVGAIKRPLLIAHGANDPRVKLEESEQIVAAMREKGIPVTFVLFPDEGHGFRRAANARAFRAITEAYFADCLGGRAEPFGDAFEGSSVTVPEGAEHVEGLAEALGTAADGPS